MAAAMSESAAQDAFVAVAPGVYRLQSPLTFATVAALRAPGRALIAGAGSSLSLDLAAVPAVDSAGLALLIDWLALARSRSCRLHYDKPAATLLALARLSEVEPLISA